LLNTEWHYEKGPKPPSDKDIEKIVEAFELTLLKRANQMLNLIKAAVIKKGYMGGGMANGKKHSYVAGGYVTDMMGKKKK
jgi:hypothetical protein